MQCKWFDENGKVVSCTEKNKILQENMAEIMQNIRDAYEDAVLMGVSSESFFNNIQNAIESLKV